MMNSRDTRAPFAGLADFEPDRVFAEAQTPCYILDERQLRLNGQILGGLAERTGCRVLLAQKAFSNYDLYPVLEPNLSSTAARVISSASESCSHSV